MAIRIEQRDFDRAREELRQSINELYGDGFFDTLSSGELQQIVQDMADKGKVFPLNDTYCIHDVFNYLKQNDLGDQITNKKFTYTIEVEVPCDATSVDWDDAYLLSAITFAPEVCSRRLDNLRLTIVDIKNEEGESLLGYPSHTNSIVYTFLYPDGYNLQMVDKERKEAYERRSRGSN